MFEAGVDISGYDRFRRMLINGLVGTGQDGDLVAGVLIPEVRQLSAECGAAVGAKTLAKAERRANADIRERFMAGPETAFPIAQRGGGNGMTWLYAGPDFLVGARNENVRLDLTADQMRGLMKTTPPFTGNSWLRIGKRGKQNVMMMNRLVVKRGERKRLLEIITNRLGLIKAKLSTASHELGYKNVPAWIARHYSAVKADGTGIFNFDRAAADDVAITFGGKAPGLETNHFITGKLKGVVEHRKQVILAKTEKLLAGYAYNWNTGAVFKPHRGEDMLKELADNAALYDSL